MKNIILSTLVVFTTQLYAQKTEEDFYKIETLPIPEGIELEIGGMAVLKNGNLAVCTRRGEVWNIANAYMYNGTRPEYSLYAEGLHEPLGMEVIQDTYWVTQRGEVSLLKDNNLDGKADSFETLYRWPLSGNYHQYSYGPILLPNGEKIFTLNLDWIGKGASQSKWRGWMFKLSEAGEIEPWAAGLRSPAGFGVNEEGDIFYAENQGDWVGSGRVTHLAKGDFAGNPASLLWSSQPESPISLKPEDIPDTGEPLYDVAQRVPGIKPPAVWFPHSLMGISTSDIVQDQSNGEFGPFSGQFFVGDQGHSKIMRMQLEKVDGVYQGACFPFREGFQSGVLRMKWGLDNSMFVGQTSRGWASTGKDKFGLQRMVWTGQVPFEIKEIHSASDGFVLNFTQPIPSEKAKQIENILLKSFNYKYHHFYGSPVINEMEHVVEGVFLTEDGLSMHLAIDSLRLGYIYSFNLSGIENIEGEPLLHDQAFFTLNKVNEKVKPLDLSIHKVTKKQQHAHADMVVSTPLKPSAKNTTKIPADWNGQIDQTITIGTLPGLKYDLTKVSVKAGSKIKLTFNNNDDMLHNLLIVTPGAVDKVGNAAQDLGLSGIELAYVPDLKEVIYHTKALQPGESESIYFEAPSEKGNYTFVCTFPGHYTLMQGVIRVR